MTRLVFLIIALLLSSPLSAYIGPGAGISVLGSLLGIIVTIVVAIGAIIMWPLRKLLKKRRAGPSEEPRGEPNPNTGDSD
jgi:hypothetical protein